MIKKVLIWRIISIIISTIILYLLTGDLKSASNNTLVLSGILVISHWVFEVLWEKNE